MGQNHIFLKMTYRQMVKNKVRTLVTIIGIMLSAALITAITVFIASLHKSMLDYKIKESGNWYGVIEQVDLKEGLEKIRQDSDILSERLMYNIGSTIEEQDGHQISVKAFSDENEISLPLELTEGRMAENSKEIVVASDLITSGILADCKVGDTIEPELADTRIFRSVLTVRDCSRFHRMHRCTVLKPQTYSSDFSPECKHRHFQYSLYFHRILYTLHSCLCCRH
jgi:hypothetical protein